MPVEEDVAALWHRIERWMADHAPAALGILQAGCSADQLERLERDLGLPLPAELVASLRRHDGERFDAYGGLVADLALHGCEGIAYEWRVWTEMADDDGFADFARDIRPNPAIKTEHWWRRRWIPFVGSDGFNLCIDMDPGEQGVVGQIIVMDHDQGPGPVVASSLVDWLRIWAEEFEAGVYEPVDAALSTRAGRVSRAVPL